MPQAIPALALAVSAVGTGYAIDSGEKAKRGQKRALRSQERAQKDAETDAIKKDKIAQMERRKAASQTPDPLALLDAEQTKRNPTLLSRRPLGAPPTTLG